MLDLPEFTAALLPKDRPRCLRGVGTPPDLLDAVACGVDLFDCVLPTRNARNGQLFTAAGALTIKQARYATDPRPAAEGGLCYTCRTFSRAPRPPPPRPPRARPSAPPLVPPPPPPPPPPAARGGARASPPRPKKGWRR